MAWPMKPAIFRLPLFPEQDHVTDAETSLQALHDHFADRLKGQPLRNRLEHLIDQLQVCRRPSNSAAVRRCLRPSACRPCWRRSSPFSRCWSLALLLTSLDFTGFCIDTHLHQTGGSREQPERHTQQDGHEDLIRGQKASQGAQRSCDQTHPSQPGPHT